MVSSHPELDSLEALPTETSDPNSSNATQASDEPTEALTAAFRTAIRNKHSLERSIIATDSKPTVQSTSSVMTSRYSGSMVSISRPSTLTNSPSFAEVKGQISRRLAYNASVSWISGRGVAGSDTPEENLALSLLDYMSNLVADVAGINSKVAAGLTDSLLAALPVDRNSIASLAASTAGQASISTESAIPFILPAVAKALGTQAGESFSLTARTNVTQTFIDIVRKGSMIINQIVATSILDRVPLM